MKIEFERFGGGPGRTMGSIESDEDFFCTIDNCAGFTFADLGEFPSELFEDQNFGFDTESGFVHMTYFEMLQLGLVERSSWISDESKETLFCQFVYGKNDKTYYRVIWLHVHYE